MKVPMLDLQAQYAGIRAEIEPVVKEIFESQWFILGPHVESCERNIAAYCGSAHGIGVSSGTDALLLALMSEQIGPGDEVITTPYTFFATWGSIVRTGATPVPVDIDPITYNIDASLIEAAITENTRAIMPVHLYGQTADMQAIVKIAEKHDLTIIEDAAQAIGAEDHGQRAGTFGEYGCFSFFPSKNLGAAGDAGMVVTDDPERYERARILRVHGMEPKYYHPYVGANFRLDALQAAVVDVKLKHLDNWSEARAANAARYHRLLADAGLADDPVVLPEARCSRHIYNQFVIRVKERDQLKAHLLANGIGCDIYYPVPLHLQECFSDMGFSDGEFPHSERAAKESLALPIYPELSDEQATCVVNTIATFYRNA